MSLPDLREALAHIEQGKPAEAIPMLERLVEELPTYVTAHVLLARAYEADQRPEEARRRWQQARFLMPNSPVIRHALRRDVAPAPPATVAASRDARTEPDEQTGAPPAEQVPTGPVAPPDEEAETVPETKVAEEAEPTPAQHPLDFTTAGEIDDLQRLIDELETARIDPAPDLDSVPPPDLDDDIEDVVSETLARIYVAQRQYEEAAQVYVRLSTQEPERSDEFLQKAAEMRERAAEG